MKQTNSEFAKSDRVFNKACELAKVEPTARQASKFRMKMGLAFKMKRMAITELKRLKKFNDEADKARVEVLKAGAGTRTSAD